MCKKETHKPYKCIVWIINDRISTRASYDLNMKMTSKEDKSMLCFCACLLRLDIIFSTHMYDVSVYTFWHLSGNKNV